MTFPSDPSDKLSSRDQTVQRLYIPIAYVDEVVPPGRDSPDAWIGAAAGDVWLLAAEEDCDLGILLTPGEIVEFAWVERLGSVEVEIRDDGTHVAHAAVPGDVTHFTFGIYVIADTLDDFVHQWRALDIHLDDDRLVPVDMARWSADEERYRFEVASAGPHFVPAEARALS